MRREKKNCWPRGSVKFESNRKYYINLNFFVSCMSLRLSHRKNTHSLTGRTHIPILVMFTLRSDSRYKYIAAHKHHHQQANRSIRLVLVYTLKCKLSHRTTELTLIRMNWECWMIFTLVILDFRLLLCVDEPQWERTLLFFFLYEAVNVSPGIDMLLSNVFFFSLFTRL